MVIKWVTVTFASHFTINLVTVICCFLKLFTLRVFISLRIRREEELEDRKIGV